MRAVRVLITVAGITDRLIHLHSLPVSIEFVSYYQRERSPDDGAHLRAMRHDVNGPIGINSDKRIWVQGGPVSVRLTGVRLSFPDHLWNVMHT